MVNANVSPIAAAAVHDLNPGAFAL